MAFRSLIVHQSTSLRDSMLLKLWLHSLDHTIELAFRPLQMIDKTQFPTTSFSQWLQLKFSIGSSRMLVFVSVHQSQHFGFQQVLRCFAGIRLVTLT